jgi:hypothetical protein
MCPSLCVGVPLDCAQGEVDWETLKIKGTCTTVEKEFLRLTGVCHRAFSANGLFHPGTLLGVHVCLAVVA